MLVFKHFKPASFPISNLKIDLNPLSSKRNLVSGIPQLISSAMDSQLLTHLVMEELYLNMMAFGILLTILVPTLVFFGSEKNVYWIVLGAVILTQGIVYTKDVSDNPEEQTPKSMLIRAMLNLIIGLLSVFLVQALIDVILKEYGRGMAGYILSMPFIALLIIIGSVVLWTCGLRFLILIVLTCNNYYF